MGEQTFGKGSVQTILPMNDEAALKLTTARYFTPSGRSIQASGIKPDIIIENVRFEGKVDTRTGTIKESDLSGHLENGQAEDKPDNMSEENNEDKTDKEKPSLVETDYQLYEALNVLKGLAIHLKKVG